jgi:DNA helicase-2/ATP-dependent DNA helicase PcrA
VEEANASLDVRCAAITYTNNSRSEISDKAFRMLGHLPPNLQVCTWYAFLLRHFIRPYQRCLYEPRVSSLRFVNGISARFVPEAQIKRHYFGAKGKIYIDKVSKFACRAIEETKGLPIQRFEQIFDRLYIDESQDLAGYDLELVEKILKSDVEVVLVGDHRQATYSTNRARKNKKYAGANIVLKFEEWEKAGLCEIEYQNISHRCVQSICSFADLLNPTLPKTTSKNHTATGHDGVFAVCKMHIENYIATFNPQILRYNRAQKSVPGKPINFGEAKGMTFERVLVFPHKGFEKYVQTGNLKDAGKEIAKIYVAVTRARQSTAIVISDKNTAHQIPIWEP